MYTSEAFKAQTKKVKEKLDYFKIQEIKFIQTNSIPLGKNFFGLESDQTLTYEQLIEKLAQIYREIHGGKMICKWTESLLIVTLIQGEIEPDQIKQEIAIFEVEQFLLA
jgi:hypothetical protein